jgi:hypothetical protein
MGFSTASQAHRYQWYRCVREWTPGAMRRGALPQRNALFAERSCLKNLPSDTLSKSPPLLKRCMTLRSSCEGCDFGAKVHVKTGTLSSRQGSKL